MSLTSTPTPRRRGAEDNTTTTNNNNSNNEKKIISNNTNKNDLEEEEEDDEGDDPYELTKFVVCGNLFEVKKKYVPIKPIGKSSVRPSSLSKDEKQNTKVAIKKITNAFENVVDAKRTLREIKLLRHLRHENVVPITDCMLPSKKRSIISTACRHVRVDGYGFTSNHSLGPTVNGRPLPILHLPVIKRIEVYSQRGRLTQRFETV